jgi:hypothetical protein
MSRQIENDHPWDDEEIAYHEARGNHNDIKLNKQQFPPGVDYEVSEDDSGALQLDQDIFDFVSGLSTEELKSELSKAEIHPQGADSEMKAVLAQHLQEERDASTNS